MKWLFFLLIGDVLFMNTLAKNYCGIRSRTFFGPRVLGDEESNKSKQGEFPWMAAVFSEEGMVNNQPQLKYQCGASIIHPEVLLTAAHCVPNNQKYHIKAGTLNVENEDGISGTQQRRVNSMTVHPLYNEQTFEHDIAILFLNSPLILNSNVNTICLPVPGLGDREDKICEVSGWGKNKYGESGKFQTILKKLQVPIVPNQKCKRQIENKLRQSYDVPPSLMCAGGEEGKDTCEGDGGSALVCAIPDIRNTYYEIGFVVAGIGCGEADVPALYANILHSKDWIDQQFDIFGFEKIYNF